MFFPLLLLLITAAFRDLTFAFSVLAVCLSLKSLSYTNWNHLSMDINKQNKSVCHQFAKLLGFNISSFNVMKHNVPTGIKGLVNFTALFCQSSLCGVFL